MSTTMFRLTSRIAKLTDGRTANVVLHAGQPGRKGEFSRYTKQVLTQSERFLESGRATGLIVLGRMVDSKLVVDPGQPVYENKDLYGNPHSGWYDYQYADTNFMVAVPGVTVVGQIVYTAGTGLGGSQPRRIWVHPNGTTMPPSFVPQIHEVPEFYRGEVAAMHEHLKTKTEG